MTDHSSAFIISHSLCCLGALWCDEIERVGGALDQAEKEAAISMCMISGNSDSYLPVTPGILHAIHHDHSYAQRPPHSTPKGLDTFYFFYASFPVCMPIQRVMCVCVYCASMATG